MLDRKTKQNLEILSKERNESISKLIRDYLQQGVEEEIDRIKKKQGISAKEILLRMASHASEGPGDSEYDKYAYGL